MPETLGPPSKQRSRRQARPGTSRLSTALPSPQNASQAPGKKLVGKIQCEDMPPDKGLAELRGQAGTWVELSDQIRIAVCSDLHHVQAGNFGQMCFISQGSNHDRDCLGCLVREDYLPTVFVQGN